MLFHPHPSFDSAIFDPALKCVRDLATARELAAEFVKWANWLNARLDIVAAEIVLQIHQGSLANVRVCLLGHSKAVSRHRYDKATAVARLDQVFAAISAGGGLDRAQDVADAYFEVFSVVLRLSDHEFGDIKLIVKDGVLHEVDTSRFSRIATPKPEAKADAHTKWLEKLAVEIYRPTHEGSLV